MKKAVLLAIVASLGLSFTAVAGAGGEKKAKKGFARADVDQSATLNLAEFTTLHQKKVERMQKKNPERVAQMPSAEEIFAEVDADQDGELTKDEFAAVKKQSGKKGGKKGGKKADDQE